MLKNQNQNHINFLNNYIDVMLAKIADVTLGYQNIFFGMRDQKHERKRFIFLLYVVLGHDILNKDILKQFNK